MGAEKLNGLSLPILRGILPVDTNKLTRDILAGVTLAALGIPEVMGYTKISGTPIVTGLYTLLLPVIAFALLGGSRHLVVSADSATAAILASILVGIAPLGSPEYVSATSLVALVVAGMLLLARVFKLGFLADFLSRSALIGFLTGVGVQVAGGELAGLVGLPKAGHGALEQIVSAFSRMGSAHLATAAISAAVLAVIIGIAQIAPRLPGALIAVIGAIAASAVFNFDARGIATIGSVPGGLPSVALPGASVDELRLVLTCATSCFLVIVAQSAATSRAYAARYEEKFFANNDLVGLAAANAAAGLSGTFVVNGSPTKTEMVDEAGGRSQLAHLTTAAVVVIVLLFLTRPLSFLPNAVLSAIVFMIGIKLIDVKGMRELFRLQRNEFWIALLTAVTVVVFTVMDGIAVAVGLSLIDQVRHAYHPRTRVLVKDSEARWCPVPVDTDQLAAPGVIVYRFEANLFYANASFFVEEILRLVTTAKKPIHGLVLDVTGINDVDYTAAKMLLQVRSELTKLGVSVVSVAVSPDAIDYLRRYGLAGDKKVYPTIDEAIAALGSRLNA
jgi:MFS superfamily sulfate permease-like transporter